MKKIEYARLFLITTFFMMFIMTGCKDNTVNPPSGEPVNDREAFEKLSDEDSSLSSFDQNYNEEDLMEILGKSATTIYPFRFGQRMTLQSRHIEYTISGDTSFARLTKTFNGVLLISASYDSTAQSGDTIIRKPFTAQVTRNLIYVRIGNTDRPYRNWRLAAVSLPEGGTTLHNDINLLSLTLILPNDTIVINNPNEYYFSRGMGWWRQMPVVDQNVNVTIRAEVFSTVSDTDFVTLTWGADNRGLHRAKKKFVLQSSTPVSGGYNKIYQQTFSSNPNAGHFHAIINTFPENVIMDDTAPVQSECWGFPYFVRR